MRIVSVRFVPLTRDRKSTRLNSSHSQMSYAVFCLKKDVALCITVHFHEQRMRTWSGEHAESTGRRIEATELVSPRFGEPDHALPIDGHTIGIEGLYARLSGEGVLPHMTCAWIKPPQAISVEFGKPDIPMPIQSQLVGCAGQRLDLLWATGVWNREPGKGIELVMPRCRVVVSEIVGSLFGEPDRIVLGHQDANDAALSVRRRQIGRAHV